MKRVLLSAVVCLLAASCSLIAPDSSGEERHIYYSDSVFVMKGDSLLYSIVAANGNNIISSVPDKSAEFRIERQRLVSIVVFALVAAGAAFWVYAGLKRRLVEKLNKELEEKSRSIEKMLEDRISMIEGISRQHQSLHETPETDFYPDELDSLKDKVESISLSMERLYQKVPMTKTLETALDSLNGGIASRTRETFGDDLSESDYQVLLGVFSGLKTKEISFITGLAQGTVRTRKSRLKDRIEALPDSPDKTRFLSFFGKKKAENSSKKG